MFKNLSIPILLFCLSVLPLQAQQTPLSPTTPLQQGYAVITPLSGTGGGLVAYETVGDLQGLAFQTAILPATTLTTSGAVIVDMSTGENSLTGPLSSLLGNNPDATAITSAALPLFVNTGISVINPNLTPANISVSLNGGSGTATTNFPSFTVGPMQQVAKFVNEFMNSAALPLPLVGVLTFTSNVPIGITALEFRGTAFSTVPVVSVSTASGTTSVTSVNNGSTSTGTTTTTSNGPIITPFGPFPHLAAGVGGPGALLLPQFVMGGGWASRIVIANVSNTQQTVRIDFFSSNGLPLTTLLNLVTGSTFQNLVIPANSAVDLGPQDVSGKTIF